CRVVSSGSTATTGEEVMRSPLASLRHAVPSTPRSASATHPLSSAGPSWSPSSAKGGGSSAGSSAGSAGGGSTFQEDLLRLIGPDYLDSDSEARARLYFRLDRMNAFVPTV
ncbi:hypothetical protein MTO96_045886, partial [Rhipicephalus appendiculatus]